MPQTTTQEELGIDNYYIYDIAADEPPISPLSTLFTSNKFTMKDSIDSKTIFASRTNTKTVFSITFSKTEAGKPMKSAEKDSVDQEKSKKYATQ